MKIRMTAYELQNRLYLVNIQGSGFTEKEHKNKLFFAEKTYWDLNEIKI